MTDIFAWEWHDSTLPKPRGWRPGKGGYDVETSDLNVLRLKFVPGLNADLEIETKGVDFTKRSGVRLHREQALELAKALISFYEPEWLEERTP
jgi:hypothetical protein